MIQKKNISVLIGLLFSTITYAQYGIGLYHTGSNVVQTYHLNPSFRPDAKLWIGTPLSISLDLNSSHSFNEYFTKSEGVQNLDYNKILANAKNENAVIFQGRLNTLTIGYEISKELGAVTAFANERAIGFMSYPKDIITLIAKGNVALLDKDIDLGNLRFSATYFREYGLGYTFEPINKLRFGFRAKRLVGLANASTDPSAEITLKTLENNFESSIDVSNAILHTSGVVNTSFDPIKGAGKGFGFDVGLSYDINSIMSINAAINDIGWINWDNKVTNYGINDSNINYRGIDLERVGPDIGTIIEDSLINSLTDFENNDTYTAWLHANGIVGIRAQFTPKHEGFATMSSTMYYGKPKTLIGLGYGFHPKKWLTAAVNLVKPPQQLFDLGGSIVLDFGAYQGYIAVDKTLGYRNLARVSGVDISAGINFIFGRPKAKKNDQYESNYDDNYFDLDPLVRPDKDVKIGHKHIYDVVQKKQPPAKWKFWLGRKDKKIKKIHARGRKPKSTRNGLK